MITRGNKLNYTLEGIRHYMYINPELLISWGYKSNFVPGKSYFSTMGSDDSSPCCLSALFTRGDISIRYGLFLKDQSPMVISIIYRNEIVYMA